MSLFVEVYDWLGIDWLSFLSKITGLLADSGELKIGRGGIMGNPLYF